MNCSYLPHIYSDRLSPNCVSNISQKVDHNACIRGVSLDSSSIIMNPITNCAIILMKTDEQRINTDDTVLLTLTFLNTLYSVEFGLKGDIP